MRSIKKYVVTILSLSLLTSSITSAMVVPSDYMIEKVLQEAGKGKIEQSLQEADYDENQKVRVIVELESVPVIEYANNQGVHMNDLSTGFIDETSQTLIEEQNVLIEDLEESIGKIEVEQQFTAVYNGFSTIVEYGEIDKIAELEQVKSISLSNEYARPQPLMVSSGELTQHTFVQEEYDMSGEGMVVAIIDTGIDYRHQDMILDEGVMPALSEESVTNIINNANNPLLGRYYTEKIPYGYNYMDHNDEIIDLGEAASMHGMHVAGTVGANGNIENGGIKGVVPNAQLLALKVFGNDPEFPSTFGDVIIAAIDDAIILGADVMNLSLGSTAALVDENDPEQIAVTRAVENGIVMSISSGNSAYFGDGFDLPYVENPDIGVVGSPGLTKASLQVASINNYLSLYKSTFTIDGLDSELYGYGSDQWMSSNYEIVPIGGTKLGKSEDYNDLDVQGKVV
ncbi:MAG: S8 family serine peptidase, partial [Candidatus Cloacimonetes bacterium]|nr:S8 family serine peptidase [Candidatus Cloacimonadota bacterium]